MLVINHLEIIYLYLGNLNFRYLNRRFVSAQCDYMALLRAHMVYLFSKMMREMNDDALVGSKARVEQKNNMHMIPICSSKRMEVETILKLV